MSFGFKGPGAALVQVVPLTPAMRGLLSYLLASVQDL